MFDAEWQARREKELCFRCDERKTLSHQCKNRELKVLLVQEEVTEEIEGQMSADRLPLERADQVEFSLNSMVGLTNLGTMKLRGAVGSKEAVVLVDCGATHNFLSLELILQL